MQPEIMSNIYQNTEISLEAFLSIGLGCVGLIVLIYYLHKRYVRYKKEREFIDELDTLEMEQSESDTLFSLVRRYALNEPVDILYSQRLFDELAVKEISRVLASPLSKESKSKFVNMIYNIRQKTYGQEMMSDGGTKQEEKAEADVEAKNAEPQHAAS